jgi:hypothetical protein
MNLNLANTYPTQALPLREYRRASETSPLAVRLHSVRALRLEGTERLLLGQWEALGLVLLDLLLRSGGGGAKVVEVEVEVVLTVTMTMTMTMTMITMTTMTVVMAVMVVMAAMAAMILTVRVGKRSGSGRRKRELRGIKSVVRKIENEMIRVVI